MDISYDQEVDAVRIVILKNRKIESSEEISPGIVIDRDVDGNPVALELLNLKQLSGGVDDYLKQFNFQLAN